MSSLGFGKRTEARGVNTLRQTYGQDFGQGYRGDTHLRTLLDRTGAPSLGQYLRMGQRVAVQQEQRRSAASETTMAFTIKVVSRTIPMRIATYDVDGINGRLGNLLA